MAKFVQLERFDGQSVWVNPDLVRCVKIRAAKDDQCTIHFDEDHYLAILGSAMNVAEELAA